MEECKHQHKDFILIHGEKYEFCAYCGEVLDKVEDNPCQQNEKDSQ